jgi:pyrroline-5-carboxylate reductase
MKATFIGGGNMASALAGGLVTRGIDPGSIRIVEPLAEQRDRLAARLPGVVILPATDAAAVSGADVVVMAVKPQQMRDAARQLSPFIGAVPLVLTIAAGVRCGDLGRWLGGEPRIVRAMPNTPALIGAGISGLYATRDVRARAEAAVAVLEACGEVFWCDREEDLDAVNAVSGNGPAYVFYFLETLEQAGIDLGLAQPLARRLAYATFAGSVALARQSADPPATLRANVTSKGGTTARALEVMNAAGVGTSFIEAVKAGAARAKELGDEIGAAR